jgi:hypothetical protein
MIGLRQKLRPDIKARRTVPKLAGAKAGWASAQFRSDTPQRAAGELHWILAKEIKDRMATVAKNFRMP